MRILDNIEAKTLKQIKYPTSDHVSNMLVVHRHRVHLKVKKEDDHKTLHHVLKNFIVG